VSVLEGSIPARVQGARWGRGRACTYGAHCRRRGHVRGDVREVSLRNTVQMEAATGGGSTQAGQLGGGAGVVEAQVSGRGLRGGRNEADRVGPSVTDARRGGTPSECSGSTHTRVHEGRVAAGSRVTESSECTQASRGARHGWGGQERATRVRRREGRRSYDEWLEGARSADKATDKQTSHEGTNTTGVQRRAQE